MLKKIVLVFTVIVVILAGVVITRAIRLQPMRVNSQSEIQLESIDINNAVMHLSKALQFKTISTRDGNLENTNSFQGLHQFLRETYPTVFSKLEIKKFPPFGLLLKWSGKKSELKPFLLMAHQDVVPIAPGTLTQWQHPPFSGDIENGAIWGRGAMDDKGSLIGILEAVSHLLSKGFTPERTVYLFFSDQEEIAGQTAPNVARYFQDHHIQFDAVLDEGGLIFTDSFPQVSRPVATINTAEKGYLDVELSNQSVGGHSSVPPVQTSVGIVSKAITRLEEHPFPSHLVGIQKQFFENLAREMSLSDRLFFANIDLLKPLIEKQLSRSPLTHAFISTTTAATIFNGGVQSNVLPAEAKAVVNFRILPGETVDSVIEHVKTTIDDPRVSIKTLRGFNPSPIASNETKTYHNIHDAIQTLYSTSPPMILPFILLGATDSRHFVKVSDNVYRFLPYEVSNAEISGFHGINERLTTENLGKTVQFYIAIIKNSQ